MSLKNRSTLLVLLFLLVTSTVILSAGCSLIHPTSRAKAEKQTAKNNSQAMKEYDKARLQHYKNQSKGTHKMMKSTKKRASEVNKPKKRGRFSSKKCF